MNEPSVLDYLKSKLGMRVELPNEEVDAPLLPPETKEQEPAPLLNELVEISATEIASPVKISSKRFPLRTILALLLALMGQAAFEPPQHASTTGLVFYFAAFLILALAYYREEWRLPSLRESEMNIDDWKFKIFFFFLSIPFILAAFFTFAGNSFNALNLFPWLLSLLLLIWSFWQPKRKKDFPEEVAEDEDKKAKWLWVLLVALIAVIVLFFRLYQIGAVPPEPFSDHAEKILDIYDITQGETHIFFPRNTGREAFQMYWTLLIAKIFGTGLTFLSLKLGTTILGLLTIPYIYLLGKEVANKRVGLIAAFLMGISYWHNVISRVGLRFPLYPLFVAPVLFYLFRGIRKQSRNDFILAGIFLGIGAHGYSSYRIMPFVVIAAILLYLLHKQSRGLRKQVLIHLAILALISIAIFLPLARYALENPYEFSNRALSRIGYLNSESFSIFASNIWDGARMINWDNGNIWVHAVPGRPALGVISGALFLLGVALLLFRYFRRGHWLDLFLLLSILLLQLPSTMSIAFPMENPAMNRAGGATVVIFLIAALAADGLLSSLRSRASRRWEKISVWIFVILLAGISIRQNYDLVFNQYAEEFRLSAWNSSEMGEVILQFEETYGQTDTVWIVPYKHWVDTRLPGVWAGIPNRDFALWQNDLENSRGYAGVKLFMVKPEDEGTLAILASLYPNGKLSRYTSATPNHDFMIFFVP